MNLKCGIIIIGSLLWDDDPIRQQWRKAAFGKSLKKNLVHLPIRYGRESRTRNNTYTMILSNHQSTEIGQGIIIEVAKNIESFSDLEHQAYALAKAEGIWNEHQTPTINTIWATIGLLINPELGKKDLRTSNSFKKKWGALYNSYSYFIPKEYTIAEDEVPIIKTKGILNIKWQDEMNKFDLLLATVTKPVPSRPLSAKEIAERMIDKRYTYYFDENKLNRILTFQDKKIEGYLNKFS